MIQLRTMKYKARFPVKDGSTLLGIIDEMGILEEGQIFCIVEEDGVINCAKSLTQSSSSLLYIAQWIASCQSHRVVDPLYPYLNRGLVYVPVVPCL